MHKNVFMVETWVFMHLKKISFLCLKKKYLNMKNGQKKKRKEYILLKGRPEIIAEIGKSINNELFKDYFKYQSPIHMCKSLNDTKNTERNKIQVDLIKSVLTDLKNRIQNMSGNEKKNWKTRSNSRYCWKDS